MVVRRSKEVYDHMIKRRVEPDTQTYQDYMRVSRQFRLGKCVLYLFWSARGTGPHFRSYVNGCNLCAGSLNVVRVPYQPYP